jgi:hypothetical protein
VHYSARHCSADSHCSSAEYTDVALHLATHLHRTGTGLTPCRHLHRDWAHPMPTSAPGPGSPHCNICAGDWAHPMLSSASGLGSPLPTSAPGLGSSLPTSAPGLGSPCPHLHRDWAHSHSTPVARFSDAHVLAAMHRGVPLWRRSGLRAGSPIAQSQHNATLCDAVATCRNTGQHVKTGARVCVQAADRRGGRPDDPA